eukprot:Skav226100  [mRNA]  locus=scaffold4179:63608:66491:- [translate_table: standard]
MAKWGPCEACLDWAMGTATKARRLPQGLLDQRAASGTRWRPCWCCEGPATCWAQVCLYLLVACALHKLVAPDRVDLALQESNQLELKAPGGRRAAAEFATCAVFLVCAYWAVANAIPQRPETFAAPFAPDSAEVFLVGALRQERSAKASGQQQQQQAERLQRQDSPSSPGAWAPDDK